MENRGKCKIRYLHSKIRPVNENVSKCYLDPVTYHEYKDQRESSDDSKDTNCILKEIFSSEIFLNPICREIRTSSWARPDQTTIQDIPSETNFDFEKAFRNLDEYVKPYYKLPIEEEVELERTQYVTEPTKIDDPAYSREVYPANVEVYNKKENAIDDVADDSHYHINIQCGDTEDGSANTSGINKHILINKDPRNPMKFKIILKPENEGSYFCAPGCSCKHCAQKGQKILIDKVTSNCNPNVCEKAIRMAMDQLETETQYDPNQGQTNPNKHTGPVNNQNNKFRDQSSCTPEKTRTVIIGRNPQRVTQKNSSPSCLPFLKPKQPRHRFISPIKRGPFGPPFQFQPVGQDCSAGSTNQMGSAGPVNTPGSAGPSRPSTTCCSSSPSGTSALSGSTGPPGPTHTVYYPTGPSGPANPPAVNQNVNRDGSIKTVKLPEDPCCKSCSCAQQTRLTNLEKAIELFRRNSKSNKKPSSTSMNTIPQGKTKQTTCSNQLSKTITDPGKNNPPFNPNLKHVKVCYNKGTQGSSQTINILYQNPKQLIVNGTPFKPVENKDSRNNNEINCFIPFLKKEKKKNDLCQCGSKKFKQLLDDTRYFKKRQKSFENFLEHQKKYEESRKICKAVDSQKTSPSGDSTVLHVLSSANTTKHYDYKRYQSSLKSSKSSKSRRHRHVKKNNDYESTCRNNSNYSLTSWSSSGSSVSEMYYDSTPEKNIPFIQVIMENPRDGSLVTTPTHVIIENENKYRSYRRSCMKNGPKSQSIFKRGTGIIKSLFSKVYNADSSNKSEPCSCSKKRQ